MESGQIIKKILLEKGIKQTWFAHKLGIPASTLHSQLTRDLSIIELTKMCSILEIPIDVIFKRMKKDTEHPAKNDSVSKRNKQA